MTAHSHPFSWIRKISKELTLTDEIPLFGQSPPIDWDRLSSLLASRFGMQQLTISSQEQAWLDEEKMTEGLGRNYFVLSLTLSPLLSHFFWVMSKADIKRLTSWMLNGKTKSRSFSSEVLQEGFYRYLCLEVLDVLQTLEPFQGFTLQVVEETALPKDPAFCIDVNIELEKASCWGRLVIPNAFRKAWAQHFSHSSTDSIPLSLSQQTELFAGLQVGSVQLSQAQWEEVEEGDFIVLDRSSYDPVGKSGVCTFVLGQTSLFQVRIRQNQIQLLDYAFYQEEIMEQKNTGHSPKAESLAPAEEEVVSIQELPLLVTVELARLRLTLHQLMQLTPGNLLELPIQPDQSVSLTVNGKSIARAELVHLGETLGVRILEMGK